MNVKQIGYQAEDRAAMFLQARGYRILERNFTIVGGEIDIIAEDGEELVIVEVKARHSYGFGSPEEAVTIQKLQLLKRSLLTYLTRISKSYHSIRIDLVAITLPTRYSSGKIRLIKNIEV